MSTIGAPGNAAGQLDFPTDVAISPMDGTVSVAELNGNRVSQFSPDGTFIRAFGLDVDPAGGTGPEKCTTATGCKSRGRVRAPQASATRGGLAYDAAGNLYLTQVNHQRVAVFDGDGDFLRAFGFDVDPGRRSGARDVHDGHRGARAASADPPPGSSTRPTGIDIAGDEVFVADYSSRDHRRLHAGGGIPADDRRRTRRQAPDSLPAPKG